MTPAAPGRPDGAGARLVDLAKAGLDRFAERWGEDDAPETTLPRHYFMEGYVDGYAAGAAAARGEHATLREGVAALLATADEALLADLRAALEAGT